MVVLGVCVVSDDADVAGEGSVFAVSCAVATGACVEETVYCGLKPRIFCTVETDTAPEPLAAINASTAIFCCAFVAESKTSLKLVFVLPVVCLTEDGAEDAALTSARYGNTVTLI